LAKVIENRKISNNIYLMRLEGNFKGDIGQFYMVRGWDRYPVLSRPISIHNKDENSISFLYQQKGEGTKILSKKEAGDEITLEGPYGNGYPLITGNIAIVGGGIGTAPLLYTAKKLKENKNNNVDIYLGFSEEAYLLDEFQKYSDEITITTKGFITEKLVGKKYDYVLTCGPDIMMRKVYDIFKNTDTLVYVSIERHMACGVGACLVCSCKTKDGNKKVCKDGPVFLGEDVYLYEEITG